MRRPVLLSLAITVVCALPVFLIGALSVQMRQDLGFSLAMLGVFIAVFRGSGAIVAIHLGKLADHLGPATSMRLAAVIAAVAAAGTAIIVRSWPVLVVMLVIGGWANALGQASANLSLAMGVGQSRQGVAFGMKQSALPLSSLLAGLAVPAIALTVGWRWAFGALAFLAIGIAFAAGHNGPPVNVADKDEETSEPPAHRRVGLLSVGMALSMAAATTLSAFTVESAVASGMSAELAGLMLTAGSLCAVAVRLVSGALADRRGRGHLLVVSRMIGAGVVGYVLLGFGSTWTLIAGTLVAFAFGWGYNGVFWFATVQLNREAPGQATGAVLVGGMVGGLTGPLVFGWIAEAFGYAISWRASALWAVLGAFTIFRARRQLMVDDRRVGSGREPLDP